MIQIILLVLAIDIQPEYYTNANIVYDFTGRDSMIYCATNGGFAAFNRLTEAFNVLTNTDGLQKNEQSCVGMDSSGNIWVGNTLGLALVESDLSNISIYPIECLTCTRIQVINCLRDSVYVGSSNGILFIDTKGTPLDFNDDTQTKVFDIDVRSIVVDDTSIWVGTASDGILRYSKDGLQLQATYTINNGLLDNEIKVLALIDNELYAGTNYGLNHFVSGHFDTLLIDYQVNTIAHLGDSLVLGVDPDQKVALFFGGNFVVINDGLPWYTTAQDLLNLQGELFCGLGIRYTHNYFGEGIGQYDRDTGIWEIKKHSCLPSNHIAEITANEHGVFVACGQREQNAASRGIGWLNSQNEWLSFSTDSVLPSNRVHRAATAPDGRVWFGYNTFPDNETSVMLTCFDPQQGTWVDIHNRYNGMEGTEAVWDVAFDYESNMYLALGRPTDKLWLIDSALEAVYYLNPQTTEFRIEIAIDSSGIIWQTHTGAGLSMTDTRNTLFDRTDDLYRNYTKSDGIASNYMRGCLVTQDNVFYACTDSGLVVFDSTGFYNRNDISDAELLDIELDSQRRLWILARDGLHILDLSSNLVRHHTFADLGIDMNFLESIAAMTQVQGFEFDPIRRCFWVGGENGLLKLTVQYDTQVQIGAASVYPNPARGNTIRIKDIPLDAHVDIYAISGRRVAEDLVPDIVFGEVVWQIPDDIASGMYFALVKSDQGDKTYKFAIVR
ncbi:MAG: T9SS type A sorting domain-containing protein [candidate division WOR-3 bacterium]|nr:MAG: T9SS type A sorting domain-containing protein [candidate division WOR-3 bacterium]